MISILLTSLIISLFCCGWRVITSEGMILYFLRKPVDAIQYYKDNDLLTWKTRILYFLTKPIILCVTCFASFWGVIIYYALHNTLSIETIICCIISAFLNTVFYLLYEKI